jgi:hypothetical protein
MIVMFFIFYSHGIFGDFGTIFLTACNKAKSSDGRIYRRQLSSPD